MKRLRLVLLTLCIPIVTLGQFKHTGYTTSFGGGQASGGGYTSTFVAGEPGASADIANGGDNTIYPGFLPGEFIILSYGLAKDSIVLAVVYQATGGDRWTNNTGWMSPDVASWHGVTVENQRVTGLDLSSNNLQNDLPQIINTLSKLKAVDVSNNELRKVPDLSGLPLSSLDLSRNRLGFDDLIANKATGGTYLYAPQKRYGMTRNDTVAAGSTYTLRSSIPGSNNQFQWIFDDFGSSSDSVAVNETTGETLIVSDLNYDKMGSYRLVASNAALPDLKIQTRNQNLWATTTVKGKVYADDQGTLLDDGQVAVYRITSGAYDLADSSELSLAGEYIIEDLVLGDFILRARANPDTWPDVIQTYYVSTDDWVNADTLVVRSEIEDVDINMVFKPQVEPEPLGATISGVIESDLPEETDEEGRVQARRKVKKAGCSMRRRTRGGGGRGEQDSDEYELFAYVESDDEGMFDFTDIPDGEYLLNIQYPGIPMDKTSDIKFVIGGDKQQQKFEAVALITEAGIEVDAYEVLYVPKPYLKNVLLYPNPTAGKLAMEFTVNRRINSLKLEIVDMQGVKMLEKRLDHQMGPQRADVDLTRYASGTYSMIFKDEAGTFRHQLKIRKSNAGSN